MSETETTDEPPKKKSKLPLIIGVLLALLGGGGGFYAVQSGLLFGSEETHSEEIVKASELGPLPDVAFVPVDPIVVSLYAADGPKHLKFSAQLEVPTSEKSNVEALMPRVVDIFNGYLRAIEVADLEDPTAMIRFRIHLLRRAQLVVGDERVKNLLIMEFILS